MHRCILNWTNVCCTWAFVLTSVLDVRLIGRGKKIYTQKFSVIAAVDISKVINKCLSFSVYSVRELFSSVSRNLYSKWLTFVSEDDTKCLKFYFFLSIWLTKAILSVILFFFYFNVECVKWEWCLLR